MSAPGRTTPPVNTAIADFGFEPCREEKCRIPQLHPKHESHNRKPAVSFRCCPLCKGALTKPAPKKKSYCAAPNCGWRRPGKAPENTNA